MAQDVECERCNGRGELVCDRCGGAGSLPGFATWGGGFTSCDVCYGSGYTTCPECNGDGYIEDWDEEEQDDEWESDDTYILDKQNDEWINNNFNSAQPNIEKEEKYHPIHPNAGRIYSIYNKDYLLTDEGFKREQSGVSYYFSYEKSMVLIDSGEAVLTDKDAQDFLETDERVDNLTSSSSKTPLENFEEVKESHPILPKIGSIYKLYDKDYLLTDEGFKREQSGVSYYFSYEKSMALIDSGEAVLTDKAVQEDAISHINTSSSSNDMVSINIDNEVIDKITYEYHNQKVTTYNKSGHTIRHWGVPYNLFLDYVNSNNHYEFRKKYFAEYGPKIREEHRDDFIFSKFHDSDIDDLLIENEIVPITIQEIKPDGTIVHIGGIRLISSYDYTWDNIRGYRLNEDIEFYPYTPRTAYYEDKDYGYWFLVSKSLSKQQLNAVYELFDHRGIAWFEDQIF